jgi:hypothetical protein
MNISPASFLPPLSANQTTGQFDSKQLETKGLVVEKLRQQKVDPSQTAKRESSSELREKFDEFVGKTFYSQMLKSMRQTVGKPAYMHGGRAEEVFQAEMDQILVEEMAEATSDQFTGPMFDLFQMNMTNPRA